MFKKWVLEEKKFLNTENQKKKKIRKPITRMGCQVVLCVLWAKDIESWIAKEFVLAHNHDLILVAELQMVRSSMNVIMV